ncbi:MAG TPA: hypothetical protein DD640_04840 [Clostridiales bacterium]|nr:hypothetical protein [Clostridiales bacterium]
MSVPHLLFLLIGLFIMSQQPVLLIIPIIVGNQNPVKGFFKFFADVLPVKISEPLKKGTAYRTALGKRRICADFPDWVVFSPGKG